MRYLLAALIAIFIGGQPAMAVEEPKFELVARDRSFEVRDYPPMIAAETVAVGEAVRARNSGFMPLANYIFAKDRGGDKIAMTAPVVQTADQKIAMTAPVLQDRSTSAGWTISFIMPASYDMASLPQPGRSVRLTEIPKRRMAVLRFSGGAPEKEMNRRREELLGKIAEKGYVALGQPLFAFYDPPWTPPFMRRNEVMVEIAAD